MLCARVSPMCCYGRGAVTGRGYRYVACIPVPVLNFKSGRKKKKKNLLLSPYCAFHFIFSTVTGPFPKSRNFVSPAERAACRELSECKSRTHGCGHFWSAWRADSSPPSFTGREASPQSVIQHRESRHSRSLCMALVPKCDQNATSQAILGVTM